jgi:hypothetical protein
MSAEKRRVVRRAKSDWETSIHGTFSPVHHSHRTKRSQRRRRWGRLRTSVAETLTFRSVRADERSPAATIAPRHFSFPGARANLAHCDSYETVTRSIAWTWHRLYSLTHEAEAMVRETKVDTFRRHAVRGLGVARLALRSQDRAKPQGPSPRLLSRGANATSQNSNTSGAKSSWRPSENPQSLDRPELLPCRSCPSIFFANFLTFRFPIGIKPVYSRQKKLHNRPQALLSKRAHERSRHRTEGHSNKTVAPACADGELIEL